MDTSSDVTTFPRFTSDSIPSYAASVGSATSVRTSGPEPFRGRRMSSRLRYFKILLRSQQNSGVPSRPNSATTTPVAPYSSTDLIGSFNNDANRLPNGDDAKLQNDTEPIRARKNHTLDGIDGERRSSGHRDRKLVNGRDRGPTDREKDNRDRHKDEGTLPFRDAQKQNYFRPSGMRNNFLGGQQISPSQRNSLLPPSSSEGTSHSDHLMAMGTTCNPPSNVNNSRNGLRPSSRGSQGSLALPTPGAKKVGTRSSIMGAHAARKESEPKYSDPYQGAPPSFQSRISELASLESETVRYERTRKVRKKKDS